MVNIQDILSKIEQQINSTNLEQKFSKQWEILEIKDGVVLATWLEDVMFSEIVEFENWSKWLVLDLLQDQVWILILWKWQWLKNWQLVKSTGQVFSINVGEEFLWRVVDALWTPIDGKWDIQTKDVYPIEKVAPGVITRQSVSVPMETWIKSIDSMVPIGRWQRELIIWDRQTWKTTIALDTILNQKWNDVYCVYVAIWQKESKIRRIVELLQEKWAMDYTIVVSSSANSPAILQYIAPYVGCTLAEYFMAQWKDALIIYDDLSKHAVAYRELSLLLKRPPGREAFPWDVFYLHSRLLERASRLNPDFGWWSLTALPIVETMDSDVSAYIPTNVISITDWQIFLETELFNSGIKPAINVWLSVSRVWWSAQTKIMKKIAGKLRLELATFRELASFAQFASDLDASTQKKIEKWKRLVEILKQSNNNPIPFYKQVVLIYAGINWYLDETNLEKIQKFEETLYSKMDSSFKSLTNDIIKQKELTPEIEQQIQDIIQQTLTEIK